MPRTVVDIVVSRLITLVAAPSRWHDPPRFRRLFEAASLFSPAEIAAGSGKLAGLAGLNRSPPAAPPNRILGSLATKRRRTWRVKIAGVKLSSHRSYSTTSLNEWRPWSAPLP